MAKDPAFLFYPGDYLRDTQCLSEKVQVAYDRIMCEHMRNICISQQQLKFFTKRLSEDEIDELMMVLSKKEGGYQIAWVAESIEKRKAYSESRRKNRVGKSSEDMLTYEDHMENENENVIVNDITIKEKGGVGERGKIPFDDFWNLYDKKVDKAKVEPKWNNLSLTDQQAAINYIPAYKESEPNKKFRRHPCTFINNRTWENEIITNATPPKRSKQWEQVEKVKREKDEFLRTFHPELTRED